MVFITSPTGIAGHNHISLRLAYLRVDGGWADVAEEADASAQERPPNNNPRRDAKLFKLGAKTPGHAEQVHHNGAGWELFLERGPFRGAVGLLVKKPDQPLKSYVELLLCVLHQRQERQAQNRLASNMRSASGVSSVNVSSLLARSIRSHSLVRCGLPDPGPRGTSLSIKTTTWRPRERKEYIRSRSHLSI